VGGTGSPGIVGVGGITSVGGPGTGVKVAVGVSVAGCAVLVLVAVGVGCRVTVAGARTGVPVGKWVGLANGVYVTVGVPVGKGVLVMVGVVVTVGVRVRVEVGVRVRVGRGVVPGDTVVSSSGASVMIAPRVPSGVGVGRVIGMLGEVVRSQPAAKMPGNATTRTLTTARRAAEERHLEGRGELVLIHKKL
jgi:hypothetical protein